MNSFANGLEIVDIAHVILIFSQMIRAINVTFCKTADMFELGKTLYIRGKSWNVKA